jgi:hypothetical protein
MTETSRSPWDDGEDDSIIVLIDDLEDGDFNPTRRESIRRRRERRSRPPDLIGLHEVERLVAPAPAPAVQPATAPAPMSEPGPRMRLWPWLLGAAACLIAALTALIPTPSEGDPGPGWTLSGDLAGPQATVRLVRQDGQGVVELQREAGQLRATLAGLRLTAPAPAGPIAVDVVASGDYLLLFINARLVDSVALPGPAVAQAWTVQPGWTAYPTALDPETLRSRVRRDHPGL